MIQLLPLSNDPAQNAAFASDPDCQQILEVFGSYYEQIGYDPPWIGYFAALGERLVGTGGFKGVPRSGKVEIAYHTFADHEGQGIGTQICDALVRLSRKADPSIQISARTLPEENASTSILKKNHFRFAGEIWDEEDGKLG
ncbi:MAG: GNAT family N-acetyltransferase [Bacteroidia bacterium]